VVKTGYFIFNTYGGDYGQTNVVDSRIEIEMPDEKETSPIRSL
jgi:hypothetical protein